MNTWQRYKTDEKYRRNIQTRQKVMESIRDFFALEGFIEIEAPLVVRSPDLSPNLDSFKTELKTIDGKTNPAYLITSPEFSMKKMLAAGCDKIFSLGKTFRNNEPMGGTHNSEFTMLEWYRVGEDYTKLMDDTERLVKFCAAAVLSFRGAYSDEESQSFKDASRSLTLFGMTSSPWFRISAKEAFAEIGLNLDQILTRDTMAKAAASRGYQVSQSDSFDDCFFKIFLTEIEPKLGAKEPVILYDYPVQMAALSRPKATDPRYAERFEAYAGGLELCNCFSELTNAVEQRHRFEEENKERARTGKPTLPIDEDLLLALSQIKSAAGNALGVDRLVMLLTGSALIEDVILFPASELFGV